jgi:CPA2 family monovalent cation:H+ antiporter-2
VAVSWLPLAAGEAPGWLAEVAGLVVGAAVVAYLAFRAGLVPIVGFLLAGVLIGPFQLGIIADRDLVDAAAEIGVILLLFTIGLEFSLDRLLRIRRVIFLAGGLQVVLATGLSAAVLTAAGVDSRTAVYSGLLVSLSSTAIVLKLLADRSQTNARHGQVALGILLFQDLAVVLMVLLVPALGGEAGSPGHFAGALAKAGLIIAVVLVVARRVMPRLLEVVARTCSPEVFLLAVVAVCFGTAYGTSLAGVSVSLGAFLAGLLVSESRFDQQALGEILPLQIVFSALFFVSIGMLLDLGFLVDNLPAVLGAVLAVLVVKAVTTGVAARALGDPVGVAAAAALLLAQVGEFSFVLERAGADAGLSPAGLGDDGSQGFLAAAVLLLIATPWLAQGGVRLGGRMGVAPAPRAPSGTEPEAGTGVADGLDGHVIIAGYGRVARLLAGALLRGGVPHLVTTLSPDGAAEAQRRGLRVLLGDSSRTRTMEEAGIRRARFGVIADDEPEIAARIAGVARALNPPAKVIVRTRYHSDTGDLKAAGATYVISDETEGTARLSEKLLTHYDVAAEPGETWGHCFPDDRRLEPVRTPA